LSIVFHKLATCGTATASGVAAGTSTLRDE
jgi:hypothetical protein